MIIRIYDRMRPVISMGACSSVGGAAVQYRRRPCKEWTRSCPLTECVISCPPCQENLFYAPAGAAGQVDPNVTGKHTTNVHLDESMVENFKENFKPQVMIAPMLRAE